MTILSDELTNDPLSRGYTGMTASEAANSLNTKNRSRDRTIIPAWEVVEATVASEFTALSAAEKTRYEIIVGAGQINVKGANTRAAFAAMFGAGTQTRTNLVALQTELISRAEELGIPFPVSEGRIIEARAEVV